MVDTPCEARLALLSSNQWHYLENSLMGAALSPGPPREKWSGRIQGQFFARSRYGPHHGIGLPTRLCVVSSLSPRQHPVEFPDRLGS